MCRHLAYLGPPVPLSRLLFDPPQQTFLIEAIKDQLTELEWRLNVNREAVEYVDPLPPLVLVEEEE